MKLKPKIISLSITSFLIWLIVLQFQSYTYPKPEEIDKRLNYLERVVYKPLDNDSEVLLLKSENHEFLLFTFAFTTYASTNLAIKDTTYRIRSEKLIKESITKYLDKKLTASFGIYQNLINLDSIPDYSVLYLGHLNLMLGCYRLLSEDSLFNKLNDKISESLFRRYNNSSSFNLESYPSAIWIADNSVAIASLKLHSKNTKSNYESICQKWINYAKENYLDEKTGTLYSTINPSTGVPEEEPRGSMLGWSILFIYQFDSEFAIDLYRNYKKHFSSDFLIFRLFKERYSNNQTNMGDIDSGPIFFGYSIPANEFALSNSILAEDYKTARKIERLISFGAKTRNINNELSYKVRFVDMNISPMAEALVLNGLTITKWTKD